MISFNAIKNFSSQLFTFVTMRKGLQGRSIKHSHQARIFTQNEVKKHGFFYVRKMFFFLTQSLRKLLLHFLLFFGIVNKVFVGNHWPMSPFVFNHFTEIEIVDMLFIIIIITKIFYLIHRNNTAQSCLITN